MSNLVKGRACGARHRVTVWFGRFDAWVEKEVLPGIESGVLDDQFIFIVASLRAWEESGLWDVARAR